MGNGFNRLRERVATGGQRWVTSSSPEKKWKKGIRCKFRKGKLPLKARRQTCHLKLKLKFKFARVQVGPWVWVVWALG